MKRLLILTITVSLSIGIFSCKEKPESNTEATTIEVDAMMLPQPVKTMTMKQTIIKRTVNTTASLVAEQETYLAPAIPGKIRSISVDVNDRVNTGQILVSMDKSQLAQTKLQYANLKKDLARMDTLLQYGSITQQSFDQLKTQVNVTEEALSNLQENTTLKAPYNGIITGKYYNDGEIFSGAPNTQAGKAAILSLVKMDVLKVYINLSESYLPLIKDGQTALVKTNVYPTETFVATVQTIYPTINASTRTFTVELRLKNPDYKLRPGMYSAVTIEMGDRKTLLAPALAVIKQTGTNNRYIFVSEGTTAKKVHVTLGERVDDMVELIADYNLSGAEIIYAGHVNLMDGDKIKLVKE